MPSVCSVSGCESVFVKGGAISFFIFPKDEKQRCKWIQACKRGEKINPDTGRICSLHFPPEAYERNLKYEILQLPVPKNQIRLRNDAIPTLHLPASADAWQEVEGEACTVTKNMKRPAQEEGPAESLDMWQEVEGVIYTATNSLKRLAQEASPTGESLDKSEQEAADVFTMGGEQSSIIANLELQLDEVRAEQDYICEERDCILKERNALLLEKQNWDKERDLLHEELRKSKKVLEAALRMIGRTSLEGRPVKNLTCSQPEPGCDPRLGEGRLRTLGNGMPGADPTKRSKRKGDEVEEDVSVKEEDVCVEQEVLIKEDQDLAGHHFFNLSPMFGDTRVDSGEEPIKTEPSEDPLKVEQFLPVLSEAMELSEDPLKAD